MRALVVTPTYLEADNIVAFLERVRAEAPDVDILVVDDNSPDGTADLAEKAAVELGQIEVLRRPKKIGLGDAYRAGFAVGVERGYGILVQIDADHSHDPAALPTLLDAVERGADLAVGSRYVPGGSIPHWPWFRRSLSKWGNRYATLVLGMSINDATSGYRAYRSSKEMTLVTWWGLRDRLLRRSR
jgi:dolichol-phosphate mannosyltransferase